MMQVNRRGKYEQMREMLNEKQWRHYLSGRRNGKISLMRSISRSRWRIIRLRPANGRRSSTDSFPSFPSSGSQAAHLPGSGVGTAFSYYYQRGLNYHRSQGEPSYPTGMNVSDEELAALHLLRETFHGEWNYTILPQSSLPAAQLI
jgi:hypothetical protein